MDDKLHIKPNINSQNYPLCESTVILPELLMPAGNLTKLRVALAYGADAVYVGAKGLSMRPDEASFTPEALSEAVSYTHSCSSKIYVGINAMILQEDLTQLQQWLTKTKDLPFDAVIVSDTGAFSLIKEMRPELNIHISTQVNTANTVAAAFWKKIGARRVILARECTLAHAEEIAKESGLEVEIFVHGAMCMAISGRCLLSAYLCGQSGAKGKCKHSCRWNWQLIEQKRPGETFPVFETGRETVFLGSTDLCLIQHIPQLVKSCVTSFKVEGRMKSESYVATVTRVYRAALDSYAKNPDGYRMNPEWIKELEAVSHRPYGVGFAFGYPSFAPESLQAHNWLLGTCKMLGVVDSVSEKIHTILVKNPFSVDSEIEWIGPGMIGGMVSVNEICNQNGEKLQKPYGGSVVSVSFKNEVVLPEHAILRRRNQFLS